MAPITRERFPLFWGDLQVNLRLCTLGTAIADFLLKLANTYKDANSGQCKTFGGAIFTVGFQVFIKLEALS
jgi:hypothetical protein